MGYCFCSTHLHMRCYCCNGVCCYQAPRSSPNYRYVDTHLLHPACLEQPVELLLLLLLTHLLMLIDLKVDLYR